MKSVATLTLAVALCAAGAVQAQAPTSAPAPTPAPTAQAAAPKTRFSVETTPIADLAADPTAKALVARHFPNLFGHPAYEMIKAMPLKAVAPYSQGVINDQSLAALQADFDALP